MTGWRVTAPALAITMLLGLVAVAREVRSNEATRRDHTQRDRNALETALRNAVASPTAPLTNSDEPLCVTGVDSFAGTLLRHAPFDGTRVEGRSQRLRDLSRQAVFAERYAELARPAPTLPKRLGSVRQGDSRTPIEPARVACNGTAFAEFPRPTTTDHSVENTTTP